MATMAVIDNPKVTDNPNVIDTADPSAGILDLLQHAARTIDGMWLAAQTDGDHAASVSLGEASHGVHRALIALREGASAGH